ncbi:MAG: glycoside hydrolase family 13 protein, partial [Marinilabiliaceae bacterium]|nr:glycoside hydrolase family 13 protein [Marinilabiliaceae bacterium]
PQWSQEVIWYQIFVERFHNGDPANDPTPENIYAASNFTQVPEDWSITPWTSDWYEQEPWAKKLTNNYYDALQHRRYGGDLQGVIDKLDYLQDLGITAIYLNPINDAPSLHKYDARYYHHIDVNFGPDPQGDIALMATEEPNDPSTWKWTSADKLFLKLIEEVHQRDMRIIVDYSWNHTGVEFWAWKDVLKNQEQSPYKDWYSILRFDDPATPENEFDYKGWLNIKSLPELKKVNTTQAHKIGHPYEGDLNKGAKDHVLAVTKRWLAPNGDLSKGIDGYRLDVADHIPMGFWRDYRSFVKTVNPDAYLVGEIWWESWPDQLMNPVPYLEGDVFDAIMFYQIYKPARHFFAKTNAAINAQQFKDSLAFQWERIGEPNRYAMMNVSATHDTPRLLSSFNNPGKYKYQAKPNDDANYNTGRPDPESYQRARLYLMHQFTNIGAPHIWNGDEMGMWGADDPDCRKPLWWSDMTFHPENKNNISAKAAEYDEVAFNKQHFEFYKSLIQLRKSNSVLVNGELEFLESSKRVLAYRRFLKGEEIIVVLNAGTHSEQFELPNDAKYKSLMSKEIIKGPTVTVAPLSGLILKNTGGLKK